MARYPKAVWRPLPENAMAPRIRPTQLIFHSIVGSGEAAYGLFSNSSNLESHFVLKKDGTLWQLMDTERRADANGTANVRAISVETEDNRDPDHDPWTGVQVQVLVELARWAHETHGIPLRRIPVHDQPGIGYHSMWGWGAPAHWTEVRGKTCPGAIRIEQFNNVILPRLTGQGEEDDDMPDQAYFDRHFQSLHEELLDLHNWVQTVQDDLATRIAKRPTDDEVRQIVTDTLGTSG